MPDEHNGEVVECRDRNGRLLGYLKVAPVTEPGRYAAQVITSRTVTRPFDAAWSLDGWSGYDSVFGLPVFSDTMVPGFARYRAADHKAITDDRRLATILSASGSRAARRGTLTLGWLRTRTATSLGGGRTLPAAPTLPSFGTDASGDAFHVIGGDDPLYRVSGSDVVSLRGDAELALQNGELLAQNLLFLSRVERPHRLVHVAVSADLVAGVADPPGLRQMMLGRPGRNVEGGPQPEPVQQAQDPVHADAGAEAALLEVGQAPPSLVRLAEEEARLGVEVEREDGGGLVAVGPPVAHCSA